MKALLDLGQPFISLECHSDNSDNSDNSPIEGIPLLLLSQTHSTKLSRNPQISDKIALLLSRGANVRATNALGKSCLHLIWIHHCHDKDSCWSRDEEKVRRHLCRTRDIANLMISAEQTYAPLTKRVGLYLTSPNSPDNRHSGPKRSSTAE